MSRTDWRVEHAARTAALRQGEEVADRFPSPPVDVFSLLREEREQIHAAGEDFGDAFDGRIRYVGPRFLLCYNTKYDTLWPHSGSHHSKVVFTVAHELGHFFLEHHREALVRGRRPHDSFTEFSDGRLVEIEADNFACGLLMPSRLIRRPVNRENFPSQEAIRSVAREFEVSLTGLLARWVQVSDFPCATIATHKGEIRFGWVSECLRERGAYRVRRGHRVECRYFEDFLRAHVPISRYAEGEGTGSTDYWLDFERDEFSTVEFYFAIPHTQHVWAFIVCDESEFEDDRFD